MSASRERRARKLRNGGVLDHLPSNVDVKTTFAFDGKIWAELSDGRFALLPKPRLDWWIANGRVVRAQAAP